MAIYDDWGRCGGYYLSLYKSWGKCRNSTHTDVAVYSGNGQYLHRFTTRASTCLAIDSDGHVVVAQHGRRAIITFHCPSGELIRQVNTSTRLGCRRATMAINSKKHILIHTYPPSPYFTNTMVRCIDYSGNTLFTMFPNQLDKCLSGRGIVCDQSDNIYIAMCPTYPEDYYDGEYDETMARSGRIHKYSPNGIFQQIVVRDQNPHYDLAITADGSLVFPDRQNSIYICREWL